jgi:F-type H+-transporting ATPase subunit a
MRLLTTKLFIAFSLVIFSLSFSCAQEHKEVESHPVEGEAKKEKFNIGEMIFHHIKDSHEWEFAEGFSIPLPAILYTKEHGVEVFSSKHFYENGNVYNGYINLHEHIHRLSPDGKIDEAVKVWDFSITKNVASMLLSAILLILVFTAVSRGFAKNKGKAPSGIQSFLEPVIVFVRDEVVKPNIGHHYEKYLPYLLTLFFFILFNNLLGLLPGGANVTGNIAITMVLALITFFITNIGANKHYWLHLVVPTGVPGWLLPLFWILEPVSVLMKPLSLMIRLFANITAGHVIILSLVGLIFIFESYSVGVGVTIFATFMNVIELLVAFLQAFIFTLLTSMYIGSSIENNHDLDGGM